MTPFTPLRLLAKDPEDLMILSAHLQDALLPVVSMVYEPKGSTFSVLANRFCWEHPPIDHEGAPLYHRVHTGICFHNVDKVYHHGVKRKEEILNLLMIKSDLPSSVHLIFSGDNQIRIDTKDFHCHMGDVQEPWPTRHRPVHIYERLEELMG
jgi:hypothetical protein